MLTDYFFDYGLSFFASGWTQFAGAFFVAFLIMLILGKPFIRLMRGWQKKGQPISENVPETHAKKAGTPTMGGILLVVAILIGSVLFMPLNNPTAWIALMALVMFGALGFVDDYKKVTSQSVKAANGLSPISRLTPSLAETVNSKPLLTVALSRQIFRVGRLNTEMPSITIVFPLRRPLCLTTTQRTIFCLSTTPVTGILPVRAITESTRAREPVLSAPLPSTVPRTVRSASSLRAVH